MSKTLVMEIRNLKAKDLLQQLEDLHWIKALENSPQRTSNFFKRNFRGIISKEQGRELDEHLEKIKNEWGDT